MTAKRTRLLRLLAAGALIAGGAISAAFILTIMFLGAFRLVELAQRWLQ